MRLSKNEWAFHTIPEEHLHAVWMWEIQREAGSGSKPWLALSKAKQSAILRLCDPGPVAVKEIDLLNASQEFFEIREAAYVGTPIGLHLFEINLSHGKEKLLAAFGDWLNRQPRKAYPTWQDAGGRKHSFHAWLRDLAVYRTGKMPYLGASMLLAELVDWGYPQTRPTPIRWSEWKRATRGRIDETKRQHPWLVEAYPELR